MSDLPKDLVVGTMCHCGDPDDCYDHWEFFTHASRGGSSPDSIAMGRRLTKPQMDAIAELVAKVNDEPDHIVKFEDDSWTMQHSIEERIDGSLFSCKVHDAVSELGESPLDVGRYRVWLADVDNDLQYEALND